MAMGPSTAFAAERGARAPPVPSPVAAETSAPSLPVTGASAALIGGLAFGVFAARRRSTE
jgi:hypothetical protein